MKEILFIVKNRDTIRNSDRFSLVSDVDLERANVHRFQCDRVVGHGCIENNFIKV